MNRCEKCGADLGPAPLGSVCPGCLLELGLEGDGETRGAAPRNRSLPALADVAAEFPGYELLETLGAGGMGVIYKARHRELGRLVALKLLVGSPADDPSFAERFAREGRAMASLNHPHIATIYDIGRTQSYSYLIMEFVEGSNLRQVMRSGRLPCDEVLQLVQQVCDALQYAHRRGIVHRDIKPENVLVDQQGNVKVIDFGLAKIVGAADGELTLTQTHQVMGSLHYMAPEQIETPHQVDHRADLYALGVMLYELITGELPLGRFSLPSEKAQVAPELDAIVLKALARRPAERYQDAQSIQTDLEDSRRNLPPRRTYPALERTAEPSQSSVPARHKAANPITESPAARWLWAPGTALVLLGLLTVAPALSLAYLVFREGAGLSALILAAALIPLCLAPLLIAGGLGLLLRRGWTLCVVAAIAALAIVPVGTLVGGWALMLLLRPQVRETFGRGRHTFAANATASTPPKPSPPRGATAIPESHWLPWAIAGGLAALALPLLLIGGWFVSRTTITSRRVVASPSEFPGAIDRPMETQATTELASGMQLLRFRATGTTVAPGETAQRPHPSKPTQQFRTADYPAIESALRARLARPFSSRLEILSDRSRGDQVDVHLRIPALTDRLAVVTIVNRSGPCRLLALASPDRDRHLQEVDPPQAEWITLPTRYAPRLVASPLKKYLIKDESARVLALPQRQLVTDSLLAEGRFEVLSNRASSNRASSNRASSNRARGNRAPLEAAEEPQSTESSERSTAFPESFPQPLAELLRDEGLARGETAWLQWLPPAGKHDLADYRERIVLLEQAGAVTSLIGWCDQSGRLVFVPPGGSQEDARIWAKVLQYPISWKLTNY